MTRESRAIVVGLIILLVLAGVSIGAPLPSRAEQAGQALPLANPGFEGIYESGVAPGWTPWHEDSGEICGTNPEPWDFACKPRWWQELDPGGNSLTRGGSSQAVGVQYMPWHAGVFQTVSVSPGTRVRFSAWGRAFASNDDLPSPSFSGWNPRLQVGIDPQGKEDWTDPGVVWSAQVNALDSWQQLSVEATAGGSGKITVFVSADFRNQQPLKHLDTWWDDASLVAVSPSAWPSPRPDGAIVHIVQSGDTLMGIALQYDVPLELIRQLNAGSIPGDIIVPGQELVIAIPSPTLTPTSTPTTSPAPTVTPQAIVTGTPPGRLEITYPLRMTVDEADTITVEIIADPGLTEIGIHPVHASGVIVFELRSQDGSRDRHEQRIRLYPVMFVELVAASFHVVPGDVDARRVITTAHTAAWTWSVAPTESGAQPITVNIFGETTKDDEEPPVSVLSRSFIINVLDKPLGERLLDSLVDDFAAFLSGFIGASGPAGAYIAYLRYRKEQEIRELRRRVEELENMVGSPSQEKRPNREPAPLEPSQPGIRLKGETSLRE